MEQNFDWNIVRNPFGYITLSAIGIGFNPKSISDMGTPEYVQVGYDEENKIIGVKPSEKCKNSYTFSGRIRNNWVRIGCRDFIRNLGISRTKRFPAIWNGEMLIVDLKK